MDIGWPVQEEKVILTVNCFFPQVFLPEIRTGSFSQEHSVLVEETNLEQVLFPGYSIIQMNNSIYEAKIPTCQFAKDIYDRHHFSRKQTSKYHKGTPQYPRKIGKSLQKYRVLKECSEIVISIKIQNTSISEAKIHAFNRTPKLTNVAPLSIVEVFFSEDLALSTTP